MGCGESIIHEPEPKHHTLHDICKMRQTLSQDVRQDFCIVCFEDDRGGGDRLVQNWSCPCKYAYHAACMNRWNAAHGYACIMCRVPQPPYTERSLLYAKIVAWGTCLCVTIGILAVLYSVYAEIRRGGGFRPPGI